MTYLRSYLPWVLAFQFFACSAPPSTDQSAVSVIEDCAEPCPEVVLEPVATLGSPDDPVLLRWSSRLAGAGGSNFVAVGLLSEQGRINLYGYDGRLIRTIGRWGAGPGEYRFTMPHPGLDGQVWIMDIDNQRGTVLGPDGDTARTFPFQGAVHRVEQLDSNHVLLGGVLQAEWATTEPSQRTRRSPPLHVMTREGEIVRSFGEWPFEQSFTPPCLGVGPTGTIWETRNRDYSVRAWSVEGKVIRTLDRRSPWFESLELDQANRAVVCGMVIDAEERLWIRVIVPTGRLRDATVDGTPYLTLEGMDRVRDTVIEVLHPDSPRVVARGSFESGTLQPLKGTDLWYSTRQDEQGYVYMDLWRARIVGTKR